MKRILAAIGVAVFIPLIAHAQGTQQGSVTVRSTPEGARATLDGEMVVSGVTPARFEYPLVGEYKLTLKRYGYETYSTRITLDPNRPVDIDVRLSPRTRFKAAARSLIIPGWGQKYTGQHTKAFLFATLAVASVATYLIVDADFDDKYDLYRETLARYDSLRASGSLEDLRRLQPELDAAQDRAYDAENVRRVMIGATVAVWGLNLLDVLLFYPAERATVSVKGLSLRPSAKPDEIGMVISKRF